ncbi:MAG TPA: hypothetical protein DCG58_06755 [Hyphomonas adhaerens]|uniref:Uncharacterized protein n=2 Tax=Hyphomonadaceae TaxID=69657 RepID=A0A3B9GWQ9_9PROT|nr:hypothetical protein [Hyphomonas sp.]HAE26838.1 hypothetical protein [Hyphomonas adhaerens]|tara:strand:- start:5870 stop:7642 length:1773 start_codon:yes stop_codon:yes gene_type:complete
MAPPGRDVLAEARKLLGSDPDAAARLTASLVATDPAEARAHRLLAQALRRLDRPEEASTAETDAIQAAAGSPQLRKAAQAMREARIEHAEQLIRDYLDRDPDDPQALRMLAEIAAVCGHGEDAERLLRKALEEAPGFVPLFLNLAALLQDLDRPAEALAVLDEALTRSPDNRLARSFKAELLTQAGDMNDALQAHEDLLRLAPRTANFVLNYGHALKAAGRGAEAVTAYRKALQLDPKSGLAWWALANHRGVPLEANDVKAIEQALMHRADDLNRAHLHYALGKALGDQEQFEDSFKHYRYANEIRGSISPFDSAQAEKSTREIRSSFTREFLNDKAGGGHSDCSPIFIVGLPRSGSTLIEQILASHPAIEGAGELFALERTIDKIIPQSRESWPTAFGALSGDAHRQMGAAYLSSVRARRKASRSCFTDKTPSNWRFAGLIHCILPNARIIDVRRHPMACCFSNFAMYFNRNTSFPSGLDSIGAYYRDYARTMSHFDRLMPGRIHHIQYEDVVENPKAEIEKLLHYLGLPFDEQCLQFHESRRAVHTPSAEQVRRPLYRDGLDRWRAYERWLDPLKDALGPELVSGVIS